MVFKSMDLTGHKYNKLTVIKLHHKTQKYTIDGKKKGHQYFWLCKCDCGNETIIPTSNLRKGLIKSCGCLKYTHHLSNTRLYRIYIGMKTRCYNSKSLSYKDYGGRGITICQEWLDDFMNFYNWAKDNGYSDNLSIDRINVNGNYEPSNCRWATQEEQSNNTRITNPTGIDIPRMYRFRKDIRDKLNNYLVG